MQSLERVIPVARHLLTIDIGDERYDRWLWERAERVLHLTQLVARVPDVADQSIDRVALGAAGLFHCAAWVELVEQHHLSCGQLLARPTSDIQRQLSAALLEEHAGHLLPPKTARLAAEAIRQCNDRNTPLIEAQLLAEAENLDDLSTTYVLRQFRQYQADGRPLRQIVATWERQQEYRYWEVRVNDGLRFEMTRQLARKRLEAVAAFMAALRRDLDGTDVESALEQAGIDIPSRLATVDPARDASAG